MHCARCCAGALPSMSSKSATTVDPRSRAIDIYQFTQGAATAYLGSAGQQYPDVHLRQIGM
jgi:hypothetical protein